MRESSTPLLFVIGERSPIPMSEGLQMVVGVPPVLILIGLAAPTRQEVAAIRTGKVIHKFGANNHTAWMTLHFHDRFGVVPFQGEVFYAASKEPEFTDEKLAKLRETLPTGIGIACNIIVVNTRNQRIVAIRLYSWSNALSLAFVDAADKTRFSTPDAADLATDALMEHTTNELADLATLSFELKGVTQHGSGVGSASFQ